MKLLKLLSYQRDNNEIKALAQARKRPKELQSYDLLLSPQEHKLSVCLTNERKLCSSIALIVRGEETRKIAMGEKILKISVI